MIHNVSTFPAPRLASLVILIADDYADDPPRLASVSE
jgi:hypothetical protein